MTTFYLFVVLLGPVDGYQTFDKVEFADIRSCDFARDLLREELGKRVWTWCVQKAEL